MDFELVAIALGDVTWIVLAFVLGYLAQFVSLPPLVGFLATGFILNYFGITSGETLQKLADLGITLLLFTVGLKLNLKTLIRPQVWAVTLIHVCVVVLVFGGLIYGLAILKLPLFETLDWKLALLIAFGMSFSSTVFVVKVLEEKGDMKSYHGRVAIGILIMQDLIAVIFLAMSSGKMPSWLALALFALIPLRPLFYHFLVRSGHGELLILYGLVLALGGAELFELVGIKDDLGALIMGVLISTHPKASEMAKSMLGFKDLFLVGFFLSIGLSGALSPQLFLIGALFIPFLAFKSSLFYLLMTGFKLRARTSLIATLNLTNYSEFGLIVVAIGVSQQWISADWLVIMAIALSLSFMVSAPLNNRDNLLYRRYHEFWIKFQNSRRLPDDHLLDTHGARIAIFGMGRVGSGAYDRLVERHGNVVIGFDVDRDLVIRQKEKGRNVLQGNPSDEDFWEKLQGFSDFDVIMLALPNFHGIISALEQIRNCGYQGQIAATAKFPDEETALREAGATEVFNFYTEAGAGFANQVQVESTINQ